MNNDKVDWHGNIVAVATPFTETGEIDETKFMENITLLLSEGAHGIAVCGCTGEAWSVTPDERLHLFRLARQAMGPDVPLIGGTSGIAVDKVSELSSAAVEAGCDGALVMPPYYAVIGQREIHTFFKDLSDSAEVPIFLYNMPKRTGINMPPSFIAELSNLEWIVALKQSSGDFAELEATVDACGDLINVFAGHSAERGYAAVVIGCVGFVSSLEAQVMGREAISLYDLAKAGKVLEGRTIQQRTVALDKAMRKVGTFPSNMKAAMNLLGRPGGYCRRPLLDLNAEETSKVRDILTSLSLLEMAEAS
jgi:dihydrodipicolinate synthase/N-acetylneuraminate lyase